MCEGIVTVRRRALSLLAVLASLSLPQCSSDSPASPIADAASDDGAPFDAASDAETDATVLPDVGVDASTASDAGADVGRDAGPTGLRVFASSALYPSSFADAVRDDAGRPQGPTVGDGLCQQLATAAGLGGRWSAWLSTGDSDAIDHVTGAGPWSNLAGRVVFPSRASLATAPTEPIGRDETGAEIPAATGAVWTGTATGGRRVARDGTYDTYNCYGWGFRGADRGTGGVIGDASQTSGWTRAGTSACTSMARIYCFER